MSQQVNRLVCRVGISLGIECAAFFYCRALVKLFARFPLYIGFYNIPIDYFEWWLSGVNLTNVAWQRAHVLAYAVLIVLNATKWLMVLHFSSTGRIKLAVFLGLFFGALLLATFSLRDLPM
jgi:hypothetical protein